MKDLGAKAAGATPGPTGGDCNRCGYAKGMANRRAGVRVPAPDGKGWGSGKCVRPGGHCSPQAVR